jgi:hypothetical protein
MDSRRVIARPELISACSDCLNLNVAEEASIHHFCTFRHRSWSYESKVASSGALGAYVARNMIEEDFPMRLGVTDCLSNESPLGVFLALESSPWRVSLAT